VYRQILGYIPSNVVPAAVSFIMIYVYTRLLSPAEFGDYSFVYSAVLVLQTSLFYALPIAVMRFYPAALLDGRQNGLLKEAYAVFYVLSLVLAVLWCIGGLTIGFPAADRTAAWLALPLLVFRSAVVLNQAVNRSTNSMARYNYIECAHTTGGFLLGLAAILLIGRTADSIILGLMVAGLLCTLIDFRHLLIGFRRGVAAIDRATLMRLIDYTWPLVAVAFTGSILQLSDRFLLGSLGSAEMLGIYAVAYSLVERPTTLICSSISTATFPMAVQILEKNGREAGRVQAGKNGAALLALILPACAGLALTSPIVAAVLVGHDFRSGVALLIPIMCATHLLRGVRAHFVDHAFHLGGRPLMMLWTYAPAAAANIVLNLLLIPHFGMYGAAWSGLICQAATLVSGWVLGQRIFPLWLPVGQVAKAAAAVVPMALLLLFVPFPLSWAGLAEAVTIGAVVYLASAIGLDVLGVRTMTITWLRIALRRRQRVRTSAGPV
jgi:O-antigen/teichoic acid export membrane protein